MAGRSTCDSNLGCDPGRMLRSVSLFLVSSRCKGARIGDGFARERLMVAHHDTRPMRRLPSCAHLRRLTKVAAHHIRSESSHLVEDPKLAITINVNFCLFKQPIFS